MNLQDRFLNLCAKMGLPSSTSSEAWKVLESRHSEPHRHYHNLRHVCSMLREMDLTDVRDPGMEFAIWFHDGVYDPKARDNEEQSAILFESLLGSPFDENLAKRVGGLILATDHSNESFEEHDGDLIRDIDLAIIASPVDAYQEYTSAIRKEYAYVPDREYRIGRGAVLKHFLSKPIFVTEGFSRNEAAARKNLETELSGLIPGKD